MTATVEAACPDPLLVVDDDESFRSSLSDALRDEGYTVVTAGDGLEAMRYLEEGARPCVILLDLMMPKMNGWAVLAAIREDAGLSAVPIIALSAGGKRTLDGTIGAAARIAKPFNYYKLLEIVNGFCR